MLLSRSSSRLGWLTRHSAGRHRGVDQVHDLEEVVRKLQTSRSELVLRDLFWLFVAWVLGGTISSGRPFPSVATC